MGEPLNIKQLIVDPWSQIKGEAVLWCVADDGVWWWSDSSPTWTAITSAQVDFDPPDEGITYDDLLFVSLCGDIGASGYFVFLGYYVVEDEYKSVVMWTDNDGDDFTAVCIHGEYATFNPLMVQDALRHFPTEQCDSRLGADLTKLEGGEWNIDNDPSSWRYSGYGANDAPHLVAYGNFGMTVSRLSDARVYLRGRGRWPGYEGGQCWRFEIAGNLDPCGGGGAWKILGTANALDTWQTFDMDVNTLLGYGAQGDELETLYVACGCWGFPFTPPPMGTGGFDIDAIFLGVPPPETYPYNIVVETAAGEFAYFTAWTVYDTPNGPEYLIKLYRVTILTGVIQEVHNWTGQGAEPDEQTWEFPWHHIYVAHPYGWSKDEVLVYGASIAENGDVSPGAAKLLISEIDNCLQVTKQTDLNMPQPTGEGDYVAHLSTDTLNASDMMALINNRDSHALWMFQSLNGGYSFNLAKEAHLPDGLVRWNAVHRHPSDGDLVVVGLGEGSDEDMSAIRTDDLFETWEDITNAVLDGGERPTSLAWKWW